MGAMFTTVDHIGFVVRDIDAAIALYAHLFAILEWECIPMPERATDLAVARVGNMLLDRYRTY
jgi:catechol 2,3-dioxygenase-like lactoylglutathione lyase family enzyme